MEVFVFKTSVESPGEVKWLTAPLNQLVGKRTWNFDLGDCDKILRIVSPRFTEEEVIQLLKENGFSCSALEDLVPA